MFGDVAFAQAPFASLGGNAYALEIAESAAASVVIIADSTLGGLIFEGADGAATVATNVAFGAVRAESATASNTQATQATYVRTVAESADALDSLSVVATINANVTGVQLYVLIGDALVWGSIDDNQNPNWQNIDDTQSPGWTNLPS